MKKPMCGLLLSILLAASCTTHGPFHVGTPYGAPVPYGEGRHPGIDFDLPIGTPIIAVSDGVVGYVGEPDPGQIHSGGFFVIIRHSDHFKSIYGHLSEVFIENGQTLKRGQLIGLSGKGNTGYLHLHFGIAKISGRGINYSQTFNPNGFWLGGKPQCFDPNMDYAIYSQKDITLPVACGEYAKRLIGETKK
jgi:murein DD-endopeptidase MepM/ murein hydrolase activator NlpD